MVQKRTFRHEHPDAHWCAALWKYIRQYASLTQRLLRLANEDTLSDQQPMQVIFLCVDDKAKVAVGEPDLPVSFGGRARRSILPIGAAAIALDHDFHVASITVSVTLQSSVPDDVFKNSDTFYKGKHLCTCNILQQCSLLHFNKLFLYPAIGTRSMDFWTTLKLAACVLLV
jgi:hypothetical protein